jgi:membrane protease YdiL (CAAX protease family)
MMWRFDYSAHAEFVEPAIAKPELWRVILGLVLILGVIIGLGPLIYLTVLKSLSATGTDHDFAVVMGILFGFVSASLGVFGVLYFVHDRVAATVFGSMDDLKRDLFLVGLAVSGLMLVIAILPPWGFGDPLIPNRAFGSWLVVLPIALLGVLIQSSAEEILFRGYLQQQLAARFKSPLIWMVLPSILFALAHYDPDGAGENAWLFVVWAGLFGLMMADLTARAGNLGPAIAVHFVNNAMALLIVSLPDELGGASLFLLPFDMADVEEMRAWMPVDFAMTFVIWLAARLAIRR